MADSRTENALVETTAPTLPRRLLLPLALLVPLVIDPYGADTLLMERLVMSLVGCAQNEHGQALTHGALARVPTEPVQDLGSRNRFASLRFS